jgi:hypothetical protein
LVIAAATTCSNSKISHSKTMWKVLVVNGGISYGYAAE